MKRTYNRSHLPADAQAAQRVAAALTLYLAASCQVSGTKEAAHLRAVRMRSSILLTRYMLHLQLTCSACLRPWTKMNKRE